MKNPVLALLAVAALTLAAQTAHAQTVTSSQGHVDRIAKRHAMTMPWHGDYYNTTWGRPISMVVPPTAHMQVNWGWGVSQSTMTPIYHQFSRPYPGAFGYGQYPFRPTPSTPSHTSQWGVYYVRGPY